MARKPTKTVCGVPADVGDPIYSKADGSLTVDPAQAVGNTRRYGMSKPGAKRLATALGLPVPRMGHQVKLCSDQYLVNLSGMFYVVRTASGDLQGRRRRRRR
jgi:hypothetical protein